MKTLVVVTFFALTLGLSKQALAEAELEIEWEKPEKYSDVRSANQGRKSFQEITFKNIEAYLGELAEGLADHQKLVIKVTNLDLAGKILPASFAGLGHSGSDVRVVKNHDIPRMYFSYQLLDAAGVVIQQNEVKLKDMAFLDSSTGFFESDSLRYEKSMLKRWFGDEFATQLKAQSELAANNSAEK